MGQTQRTQFIQVITNDFSVRVPFQKGNYFSNKGIRLQIKAPGLSLSGIILYGELSPIRYDIMGPFRFFPMECRHEIISMRHLLLGSVRLNHETYDFTGGIGYIEGDSGCSFPTTYTWVQANDFKSPCSVMASVAAIPFWGLRFRGCICIVQYKGREYRLATYLGVRVLVCTPGHIILRQGSYTLDIKINTGKSLPLSAPQDGKMVRTIRETASCPAEFRLSHRGNTIFHLFTKHAGFEYEG